MLNKIGLAAVMVTMFAAPALAGNGSCGSMPVPPAMPSADDIAHKSPEAAATAKHNAFLDVKNWQSSLNDYRNCLDALMATDKQKMSNLDPGKDADKISALQAEMDAATGSHDSSVDSEERVVNDFHAVQAAYCIRNDVDRSTCPK